MMQLALQRSFTIGNKQYAATRTLSGNIASQFEETLAAAQPGTLTTRTSNTDGTLTMNNAGHGITNGVRLDIYWNNGANVAYGATVGVVSGTSVPFTGAQGTVLPAASTAVTAMIPVAIPFSITGNNMQALTAYSDKPGLFVFADATPTTKLAVELITAADAYGWGVGDVAANPLAGLTVTQCFISHSDGVNTSVMRAGMLTN